jgi:DNA-binding phage protein
MGHPREEYGPRTEGDEAMKTTYAPFDAADYLDNDEVIAEYLSAAVEDPDPDVFLAALGDVARARRRID